MTNATTKTDILAARSYIEAQDANLARIIPVDALVACRVAGLAKWDEQSSRWTWIGR